jgi:hypothetical protein
MAGTAAADLVALESSQFQELLPVCGSYLLVSPLSSSLLLLPLPVVTSMRMLHFLVAFLVFGFL